MAALIYLIETLLSLCLLAVLLRLLLQWVRADFRNPLARSLVQITNPVVLPLRRVFPAVGKIDTAAVVAIVVLVLLKVATAWILGGLGLPPVLRWLHLGVLELLQTVLWAYFFAIFLYALLSLIAPGTYSPAQGLLQSLCEPLLQPIRRLIPPLGGLDLSPLWAGIAIQALLILLR